MYWGSAKLIYEKRCSGYICSQSGSIFYIERLIQTQVNGPLIRIAFNDGFKDSNYLELNDRVNNNELRKRSPLCPNLRYSPAIRLLGLRIPHTPFHYNSVKLHCLPIKIWTCDFPNTLQTSESPNDQPRFVRRWPQGCHYDAVSDVNRVLLRQRLVKCRGNAWEDLRKSQA
jgi:hypothetical protein